LKRPLKIVLGLGVAAIVAIQFNPVANALPAVWEIHLQRPGDLAFDASKTLDATTKPPADVKAMLDAACYDCHSHATRWPWYSYVAPVKWFVIEHVNQGRKKLNFSLFGDEFAADQAQVLREAADEVDGGHMPIESYTWGHSAAKLSGDDKKKLVDWFRGEARRLDPEGEKGDAKPKASDR
jgi:hypothetical protein